MRQDIKTKNLNTLPKETRELILQNSTIEEKYDGIKINLFRNENDYNEKSPNSNWIIVYKKQPFTYSQCKNFPRNNDNIGIFNFWYIADFIDKIHKPEVPKGLELFCEFIIQKPSLTRTYKDVPKLFVLSKRISKAEIDGFIKLTEIGTTNYNDLNFTKPRKIKYSNNILNTESELGGKIEGIIAHYNNEYWKLVQDDQYDKEKRREKASAWLMDWDKEKTYIKQLDDYVSKKKTNLPVHEKKSHNQILEDLEERELFYSALKSSNNALIVGRFQPLTKAHADIIKTASKSHNKVLVVIVRGKKENTKSPFPRELTEQQIHNLHINNVEILWSNNGSLFSVVNRWDFPINYLYYGDDRDYSLQCAELRIKPVILQRNDISGTKVRELLTQLDIANAKRYIPGENWNLIPELIKNL